MYFSIITFGCQMNSRDSRGLANMFSAQGMLETDDPDRADIIVINSCTVRQHAEDKALSHLGTFLKKKRRRVVGLMGCAAERNRESLLSRFPDIDFVVGPSRFEEIPLLVQDILHGETGRGAVLSGETTPNPARWGVTDHRPGVSAWVTIMVGCSYYCQFCIVPFVRGKMRSIPEELVYKEMEGLREKNYKEAILLGQTVNAYGVDLKKKGNRTFSELLIELDRRRYVERIRFTSPYPTLYDELFIRECTQLETVCPHYHMPVQSGSNRILKAMRRKYTREEFIEKVEALRERRPDASLTTDIIVGFPGETEEDYQETVSLLEEVRFDHIFAFIYSPRENTGAFPLGDPVCERTKKSRLRKVLETQEKIQQEKNDPLRGRIFDVLIESRSPKDPAAGQGRTETNRIVIVPETGDLVGRMVPVKIESTGSYTLFGRRVPNATLA